MTGAIATLNQVSYMYPRSDELVLKNVTMEIRRGEFLGLIGPTGAGKTTLCLTLNGIVPQFYGGRFFGDVKVKGLDTLEHPISRLAQHVSVVFEDPETQITATSVENEIAFALENLKVPREEIIARIPRVLEAARLEGTEKKHPHELSGGQKQRLAIAAALAVQPDLLILDEPTSQLDPVGSQEVFATVRELNEELGVTIVMASHASEEMAEFADRLILLYNGELVMSGTPDELYADIGLMHDSHLRPPQVATTFYHIRQSGISVPRIPVSLDRGIAEIRRLAAACEVGDVAVVQPPQLAPEAKMQNGSPLLSVNQLEHVYGDGTQALKGVSLDIREGEYVLIIGQNGAGKSTLVKHFLRLLVPTKGTVLVGGTDTHALAMSTLARRIGYVAQNPDNQIFNATVEAEVSFALENLKFSAAEVQARTEESLAAMGLLDVRDRHPLALPRGDRARVVIAAILAMKPEIIIFDEPTTGQDYRGARTILEISKRLHEMGKTVIVITHHLYLMPNYAERVIVMGKGTILLDAPIRHAFHERELLASTYLTPPQAVLLAQALAEAAGTPYPLLTPEEVAACFQCAPERDAA
ncbi:MAG: ATP-binding cassette domain-containing protein [Anaerolineae bacterium]|nr:ATP-binding cassette domain-containing protein [Anaerolineae bacterium]